MKYIIWPVAKNPATGRIGPKKFQDWYRGCVKAVKIEKKLLANGDSVKIAVVSAVHIKDKPAEADFIFSALEELGAKNIHIDLKSYETIGELEAVQEIAIKENAELIIISTFGHYLRVRWLARKISAKHFVAFGIPRPKELITDIILTFLFPIIDLLGKRDWFRKKVESRRENGKH
jgi:hypothetical protein